MSARCAGRGVEVRRAAYVGDSSQGDARLTRVPASTRSDGWQDACGHHRGNTLGRTDS